MKCLMCGKSVKSINYRHLKSCSDITTSEYQKRFPNAEFMDSETRGKVGRLGEENGRWKDGRRSSNPPKCETCKKVISHSGKSGYCISCHDKSGQNNPFFGRRHTAHTRQQMVKSAKARDASTYHNFIEAGHRATTSTNTSIEKVVKSILDELNVGYQQHHRVGQYWVDFFLPCGIIIECYGDFWHCNPEIYDSNFYNTALHMTAKEKWEKDKQRQQDLESQGYRVVVLWGTEIRKDQALKERINGTIGR